MLRSAKSTLAGVASVRAQTPFKAAALTNQRRAVATASGAGHPDGKSASSRIGAAGRRSRASHASKRDFASSSRSAEMSATVASAGPQAGQAAAGQSVLSRIALAGTLLAGTALALGSDNAHAAGEQPQQPLGLPPLPTLPAAPAAPAAAPAAPTGAAAGLPALPAISAAPAAAAAAPGLPALPTVAAPAAPAAAPSGPPQVPSLPAGFTPAHIAGAGFGAGATEEKKVKKAKPLPNPGMFDKALKESKNVVDLQHYLFQGARFGMNKRVFKNGNDVPVDPSTGLRQSQDDVVDKQLTLGTNVAMGNPQYPDGSNVDFRVNTTLGKNREHDLTAEVDSAGFVSGRQVWKKGNLTTKNSVQISPDGTFDNHVLDLAYKGSDWSAHTSLNNLGSSVAVDYFQALTADLAAGLQIGHSWGSSTVLNGAARYKVVHSKTPDGRVSLADTYNGMASTNGSGSIGYHRQASSSLGYAAQLTAMPAQRQSLLQVGVTQTGHMHNFKAGVDTEGTVMAMLDQGLSEMMQFHLSGSINHSGNKEGSFGFGLSVSI